MSFVSDAKTAKVGFTFVNIIIIVTLYNRTENPLAFILFACGIATFSFFLSRAIAKLIGSR